MLASRLQDLNWVLQQKKNGNGAVSQRDKIVSGFSAAGVLVRATDPHTNRFSILLEQHLGQWRDLGDKSNISQEHLDQEVPDKTIADTASRAAFEQSRGIINIPADKLRHTLSVDFIQTPENLKSSDKALD